MTGPLAGVRVLDFTWVGAGSFTTKLLADHGADVIKVESAKHLDSLRVGAPFAGGVRGVDRSGYFAERNTSKRGITLNLKDYRGQELARRLTATADVVANNFRPGVMDRFGLGYEQVRAVNPRVVYLSMSMQGATGPEKDNLGYGLTITALIGLTHLTGLPDRYPVGTGTNYPDHVPNPCHAAFAVLAALRHVRRTGEGQLIDIAQTEPTIAAIAPSIMEWTVNGVDPPARGNTDPTWCPHGIYRCAGEDEWLAVAVRTDAEWRALAEELALGAPPQWTDEAGRRAAAAEVDAAVQKRLATWRAEDAMAVLQGRGIPAGVVRDTEALVRHDPQLAHREHWQYLRHREMGTTLYGAPPFRLSVTPGGLHRPAPLLGEHTREVLTELLGLSDNEITELAESDVLT
ncbi:CaiB/BaiF CoA transferase family protein [Actinophytocola oryzae]|uniref:Benzylsuccinate CoA-transferase BbsF subunit n=1 Tax=Actinophytocola oryzae TaxID=502181 RepID=A0A4R7W6S8_9PSEU|nr:CoA transferase [Actinophytocola oryzae]TDV57739.1 benzylsuccinate CoA-transferase BbsF subunit [Actinophytocola oryzae]